MEEQKLRMKPALKQQTNVQRIKSVTVWYSLKSAVLNLLQGRNTNVQRITAKTIYKIMVIES